MTRMEKATNFSGVKSFIELKFSRMNSKLSFGQQFSLGFKKKPVKELKELSRLECSKAVDDGFLKTKKFRNRTTAC